MNFTGTGRYGLVLALVACSIVFQMSVEGDGLVRWVTLVLQALTLVAAVRASAPHQKWLRLSAGVAAGVALSSLAVLLVHGMIPLAATGLVAGLLVAVAPYVIAGGLLRQVRADNAVTAHTLAGVLAIYLLIGMFFAFMYGVVDALAGGDLFVQVHDANSEDRLYFSFVTMCTVGYGDLTVSGALPRTLAVGEMLIGQIYLVTVVAVIVSNLRRSPQRPT